MRDRLLLPALTLVVSITSLVASFGTPLIPKMVDHFGVPLHDAQWVLTVPMLSAAVLCPLIGGLGGAGRQRRLLLICLGVVALGLALSALPLGFTAMLVGRAMQGVGLALAPVAISIARGALGERSLPAIANLSVANVVAAGLSYPLASLLAGTLGVHGAYAVALLLTLATLLLVWYAVPETAQAEAFRIDWWGALILAGGAGAVLLMLSQLGLWSPLTSIAVTVGGALLISFWSIRSLRVDHPLIDLRQAASPKVSLAHIVILLAGVGGYLFVPLVMLAAQDEHAAGIPFALIGLFFIPYSLMAAIGSRMGNRLRGVLSLTALLIIGTSSYILGSVVLALWHSSVLALVVGMAIGGFGSGCTFAIAPLLIVQQVPSSSISSALSFNLLLRYFGFSIGSALVPVLVTVAASSTGDSYTIPFLAGAGFFALCVIALLLWPGVRGGRDRVQT